MFVPWSLAPSRPEAFLTASTPSASSALRAERNRFLAFAFAWPEVLLELDAGDRIVYANGAVESLLGRRAPDLIGSSFVDLVIPAERAAAGRLLASVDRQHRTEQAVLVLRGRGDTAVSFSCAGHRLPELGGHTFLGLRGAAKTAPTAAEEMAARDAASGLLDSKAFVANVCRQFADSDAAATGSLRLSLVRIPGLGAPPVDGDATADDELLRAVGGRLRARSSDGDLAARFGPDQFGLVHDAGLDLGTLGRELAELLPPDAHPGAAGGIETASLALEGAEMRTEEIAKGVVYIINRFRSAPGNAAGALGRSASFASLTAEAARVIDGLKRAIGTGKYDMVFQPIIDAQRGTIHHYEALARFPRSTGLKTTFEHISLAEEVGLIDAFDIGMARKVVEWLRCSRSSIGVGCAVNLSGQSAVSASHAEKLHELLADNRWLRGRLSFEITESSRMHDLAAANRFVLGLRAQGYVVCLDDFGAGAANFGYLATLDVDIVKFDGPAMQGARKTPKGLAFLKALVSVCRDLDIRTVFDMVDDASSLEFARSCGADYVQGYLFGKPNADVGLFPGRIPFELFGLLKEL